MKDRDIIRQTKSARHRLRKEDRHRQTEPERKNRERWIDRHA